MHPLSFSGKSPFLRQRLERVSAHLHLLFTNSPLQLHSPPLSFWVIGDTERVLPNIKAYRRIEMSFRNQTILLLTVFVFVGFSALQGFAETSDYGAKGALSQSEMDLKVMLTYAIEDEHLAKAEYELIMDKYGEIRPFSNIKIAEERHIEWVMELFKTYDYAIPADTAKDHVVLPQNLKNAYETGVQAEIDNIAMYEVFLERELPADVRDVFEQLKAASENHLRAFQNNLRKYS